MPHLPLLVSLTVALALSLVGGLTPGFSADTHSIAQLAELGVILLMFGIGLHFSFEDLWRVRDIAIPGALVQMAVVTVLGAQLAGWWGFSTGGAWVFGVAAARDQLLLELQPPPPK